MLAMTVHGSWECRRPWSVQLRKNGLACHTCGAAYTMMLVGMLAEIDSIHLSV